jgi:hypothetical protein
MSHCSREPARGSLFSAAIRKAASRLAATIRLTASLPPRRWLIYTARHGKGDVYLECFEAEVVFVRNIPRHDKVSLSD